MTKSLCDEPSTSGLAGWVGKQGWLLLKESPLTNDCVSQAETQAAESHI